MISIDLSNQTAFITGASRGLGHSFATTLHSAGANVVINFLDDEKGENRNDAEQLAKTLGERAIAVAGDVRNRSDLEAAMDKSIAEFGALDIVVANAGILRDRSINKMSDDEWQAVIDTNLTGVYNTTKAASTRIAEGGRIVNIASIAGVLGTFGQANYSSAKAGVIAFTKVTSREFAAKNVRANAIAPGLVVTEMTDTIPVEHRKAMLTQVPMARFAQPEEIATTVLFLVSPLSSYISGQTIHVNGAAWG